MQVRSPVSTSIFGNVTTLLLNYMAIGEELLKFHNSELGISFLRRIISPPPRARIKRSSKSERSITSRYADSDNSVVLEGYSGN